MNDLLLLLGLMPPSHPALSIVYAACAIPVVWADIRWLIIPDIIVFPATGIFVLVRVVIMEQSISTVLLPMAITLAVGLVLWMAARGTIGWGDSTLAIMTAAAFGGIFTALAAIIAILLAASFAAALLSVGKVTRTTRIPWAPFLVIAALGIELLRYTT